ncbi:MAG TPA: hypothetical protein ENJ44_01090, partial [Oceanospirillales bacterium]|nr:hypothetical protein [Oceanospirillales bacterium]
DLEKFLISNDSAQLCLHLSHNGLQFTQEIVQQSCQIESDNSWLYKELTKQQQKVHIFGAGHVSLPTSQLLNQLGFAVSLYDNRDNINTFLQNNYAQEKCVIDYSQLTSQVKIDEKDYVLVMTHKFTEDKLLLSQLLDLQIIFLGVLGSVNKINIMLAKLRQQGFSQHKLAKLYAPIGLPIKSQSPMEIAVSIAAQIISFKNDNHNSKLKS